MKNQVFLLFIFVMFITSGCSSKSPEVSNKNIYHKDYLKKGNFLAYAIIDKDTKKVIKIVKKNNYHSKNTEELIIINNNGFYPDYKMTPSIESGNSNINCSINSSFMDKTTKKKCNSIFFPSKIFNTAVVNTLATGFTFGLTLATGSIGKVASFDKVLFNDVVKKNNLVKIRNQLIELENKKLEKARKIILEKEKKRLAEEAKARKIRLEKEKKRLAEEAKARKIRLEKHNLLCKALKEKIEFVSGIEKIKLYNKLQNKKCN